MARSIFSRGAFARVFLFSLAGAGAGAGAVTVAGAAGCAGGALDQPTSPEIAMELEVHLVDPPATTSEIGLALGVIPYCPITELFNPPAPQPIALRPRGSLSRPFDPTAPATKLQASSYGSTLEFACRSGQTVPLIRFLQPALGLVLNPPANGPEVPWTSHDAIIAYTDEPAAFTPFGPTDQPIPLSPGYTILRRTCGSPDRPDEGSWQLRVGAPEEPIDLYAPGSTFYPQPSPSASALLEQSERTLLEGCGIRPSALDLGTRLNFDRATSLTLSANGQVLIYLLPIDRADPAQGAALRSMNLADGSVRQLGIVPDGRAVETDEGGNIYVATETTLLRAEVQPDGSTTMKKLPIPANGRVSPDGRWIVYADDLLSVKVWDVAAGTTHIVDAPGSTLFDWSPASLLVLLVNESGGHSGITYDLVSASDGQRLEQFPSAALGYGSRLSWSTSGPALLSAPTIWTPEQPTSRANVPIQGPGQRDFGLVLQDLTSGSVSPILDAQAGSITFAAGALSTSLVWARKCLGLFETVCSFDLHRVTIAAGEDQIVAVADSAAPVALAASGRRFAIAARDGIYLRDLP
jgi:hypothetical protein